MARLRVFNQRQICPIRASGGLLVEADHVFSRIAKPRQTGPRVFRRAGGRAPTSRASRYNKSSHSQAWEASTFLKLKSISPEGFTPPPSANGKNEMAG